MELLDHIPAIVRISVVFTLIIIAIRKKVSLGNAMLGGAIILGLIFGLGPGAVIRSAVISLIHPKTLSLSIVVMLILVLSHSMETAGQMSRLLSNFRGLIKHPGLNLIVFPALIGLLPMPGGAIFSAPMVKNLGNQNHLSPSQLSYVNYWFRHIWEYWWPLYPGVLLTTALAGLNLWSFILFLFPLTIVAMIAGYWPLKNTFRMQTVIRDPLDNNQTRLRSFLRELIPIFIVICGGLGLGILLSQVVDETAWSISKETGLIIALFAAIIWVWRINGLSTEQKRQLVINRRLLNMFYMVASILVFKGLLQDSHAVDALSRELIQWNIPLAPVTVILPMVVGSVSGITIAFVGTTFPILISLIQAMGQENIMLPYMMLGIAAGFVGVLLSPLHLCLLLSNEYFQTKLEAVYRHLWLPCSALLFASVFYFWVSCALI